MNKMGECIYGIYVNQVKFGVCYMWTFFLIYVMYSKMKNHITYTTKSCKTVSQKKEQEV